MVINNKSYNNKNSEKKNKKERKPSLMGVRGKKKRNRPSKHSRKNFRARPVRRPPPVPPPAVPSSSSLSAGSSASPAVLPPPALPKSGPSAPPSPPPPNPSLARRLGHLPSLPAGFSEHDDAPGIQVRGHFRAAARQSRQLPLPSLSTDHCCRLQCCA